ncbi:energy-coupling factor transport system ATP-binding protein [Marine Group I thaumarchaeote SCGC AAA799-B03]|uniref:Energy-coupling factor transport system ATP-binding protein n=4 Tax=Marine Group I TaxID=905826 RepID=A0A087S8P7_9ARCH|nr:energy-coupling factor transport system ATP-binding protein [Marine Group I thaumarchaeote SCGC AAA799-N04]KFM17386.1 energy-coupling factor transport system ATP-binding protein [Marine Group I thaumarchaeote SCGC AAA799-D11]KFM19405.1 energy-coupling factor transport system ATP-binding protein [Marine Group I thaumarchaeote SCGC RSA3]KFM22101.1 energy-coupling factor transport system ATP-binding protein [Marine Group I thaumarchaeote SCGC AAA799-B03]
MTHRVGVLDHELCQPKKCGLECIKYCPVNKSGADCIVLNEESKKAQIDEDICNGCGICVKVCPFDAITIVNLASELATDKIHQYGPNSFRLYKLPTPKKGEVVGLLGRNGMGKSTVVNILSGNLKPNLGRYEEPPEWDEILKYYSGTELKQHFEKIKQNQIRASIKPQQVYHIAQAFDGTGKDLIEKYDDRGVSRELIKELGLQNSVDQSLKELSGGELQRIAVAAAASKDTEFYFFDEPSSYNDVFQRTGVARVIQSLAKLGKSVMVVEHDLTLLDFLSDYIEVLYGEPSAYGIVSNILSTKVGINVFLDGYLPNENVRFRDKAFSFDVSSTSTDEFQEGSEIVNYPKLTKKYPSFSVEIDPGRVRKGEVLGIMGANALGKTTMMKMIAGVEKPDSGEIDKKIKIAYKPQYLQNDIDVEVVALLDKANGSPVEGSLEEEQILDPLKIKKLYNKSVKNLSGGELQKVAVASCLLQKVDLYALDEPSAFLDVEDRIAVAKFLQKFVRSFGKSAIVIDHDLQLMDLISDTMVIFEGESGAAGKATSPLPKAEAMNKFLRSLDMSFRRDEKSLRPRVNKLESRLDKDQKSSGNFYYKN